MSYNKDIKSIKQSIVTITIQTGDRGINDVIKLDTSSLFHDVVTICGLYRFYLSRKNHPDKDVILSTIAHNRSIVHNRAMFKTLSVNETAQIFKFIEFLII